MAKSKSADKLALQLEDSSEDLKEYLKGKPPTEEDEGEKITKPTPGDPEWTSFVMSQFLPGELDENGNPFVHGLRRVCEQVYGSVLACDVDLLQAPSIEGGRLVTPAITKCTLRLLVYEDMRERVFTDLADVSSANTPEAMQAYPTAVCATRTEARAYRKALRLRGIAAEEGAKFAVTIPSPEGPIENSQKIFIENLCKRLKIDLKKFLCSGRKGVQYASLEEVKHGVAASMCERLSSYQTNPSAIPESIRVQREGK